MRTSKDSLQSPPPPIREDRIEDAKLYTTKQMGDACEMLIAAELTLAGVPAMTVPNFWPCYDVVAQPKGCKPVRISVKSRTYKKGDGAAVSYEVEDEFDWLAIVIIPHKDREEKRRRMFLLPKAVADQLAHRDRPTSKTANQRWWHVHKVAHELAVFENNFTMRPEGNPNGPTEA